MQNRIALLCLTVLAVVVSSATHLVAGFIPPDLLPNTPFQLLFVTAGSRDGTSANIADYNAFVTSQAALEPTLPITTWHAVASTAAVNANVNAPSGGLPVYTVQGETIVLVGGLYGGPLIHGPPDVDQHGALLNAVVWTGSDATGTGIPGLTLGTSASEAYGLSGQTGTQWAFVSDTPSTEHLSLYALSDPITLSTPEPATLTLLGSAISVFGAMQFFRSRRGRQR
jgi:hypothetical protein